MKTTFDTYEELSWRTMNNGNDMSETDRRAMLSLGVAGEGGEVADYMKKVLFHHIPLDKDKLIKELGDCLWYISCLSRECGTSLLEVAETNVKKLEKRYPNGFSTEASVVRADGEVNDQDAEYQEQK